VYGFGHRATPPSRSSATSEAQILFSAEVRSPRPIAAAGRHRHHRQLARSQAPWRSRSHSDGRSKTVISSALTRSRWAFSKLEALFRAAAARTMPDLWQAIANALKRFSPDECQIMSPPLDTTQPDKKCSRNGGAIYRLTFRKSTRNGTNETRQSTCRNNTLIDRSGNRGPTVRDLVVLGTAASVAILFAFWFIASRSILS
jgi:hypothetical protein